MSKKPKSVVYKGTKYTLNRGYYKTTYGLHRRIWEDCFGEIPIDYHIHHKNGDTTDNRIENLECIHKTKHHSMHFSAIRQLEKMQSKEARLKRREWMRSEIGRKKQGIASKKGWSIRKYVERTCIICEKIFKTKNLNGTKYCSQICRSRCQTLRETISKNCVICGTSFLTRNYAMAGKTCSQKCKGLLISKTKSGPLYDSVPSIK